MITPQDVFQQCHEHLRICEQRRDLAVGVLLTIVLAVLAVSKEANGLQPEIKLAFTVIAMGTFTLLGLYRRWKLIHLHASSVFMKLSQDNTLPCVEQAETVWNEIVKKSDSGFRFRSEDTWLLLIAVAVSAVITVPFIRDNLINVTWYPLWLEYLLAIVAWFLIAGTTHSLATRNLHSFPKYAWMFRGLKSSQNVV